ncbi:hypothetical protein [Heliorestis acidaminivorans]|nr:hypothetical protein [Heliorestis acidaminivorans]
MQGNPLDSTTFEFLRLGWWFLHILFIMTIFYLGHRYWPKK